MANKTVKKTGKKSGKSSVAKKSVTEEELRTDEPLCEKDQVKQAEEALRSRIEKSNQK